MVGQRYAERRPTTADYQLFLRLTFVEWGLPERLAVDHDSVFIDSRSPSPFPSRFHLWLQGLGIRLVFGRKGRPTDQGVTERSHQLWDQQVVRDQTFPTWQALYLALQERRTFLNEGLPCATLDEQPPLVAHPEARVPRRLYRPEWEVECFDLTRIYEYLAQGRWFRQVSRDGTLSLGGQVYHLGRSSAAQQLEIIFDPSDHLLCFRAADGTVVAQQPLQGISAHTLIGELADLLALPVFQLALPLTWDEWRLSRLSETLGV